MSSQDAFAKLTFILEPLIDEYVPKVKGGDAKKKHPWKSNPPTSLKRQRKVAWESYKDLRSKFGRTSPQVISALKLFLEVNNNIRSFASKSQIEYEKSLIGRSKESPKLLHSYIRHTKQYRLSIGPLRLCSGIISDEPAEMALCLLDTFSGIHVTTVPSNPAPHQQCDSVLDDIDILPSEVHTLLKELDPNSCMGLDGLHPQLLKSCASSLTTPLYMIFRQSLLEGKLPLSWKSSLIVPIFKKGSRHDPKNYRPVSLTSVPCKSLERVIAKGLCTFFTDNSILSEE